MKKSICLMLLLSFTSLLLLGGIFILSELF